MAQVKFNTTGKSTFAAPTSSNLEAARLESIMFEGSGIEALQAALKALGLYSGPVDGIIGPKTTKGIRQFYYASGLDPDEFGDVHLSILINSASVFMLSDETYHDAIRRVSTSDVIAATSEYKAALRMAERGEYKSAEQMLRSAYETFRTAIGDAPAPTVNARSALSLILSNQGRFEEAKAIHHRVLERIIDTRSAPSALEITARANLASILHDSGRYVVAESLLRDALQAAERLSGVTLKDLASFKGNLAVILEAKGDLTTALELYQSALSQLSTERGYGDPATLSVRYNIATLLNSMGEHEAAERELSEILAARKQALGAVHPDVLRTRAALATAIGSQGRMEEATFRHQELLEQSSRVLGPEHPATLQKMTALGLGLVALERYEEAEPIFQVLGDKLAKALGKSHPQTIEAFDHRWTILRVQKKYDEALRVLEESFAFLPAAYQMLEKIPLDLEGYLRTAWLSLQHINDDGAARTFPAQGYLTYGTLDVALSAQAARRQLEDDAAAKVLRAFQDAREELQRLRRAYLASFKQDSGVTEAARARIQTEMRAAQARFDEVSDRMERDFPALAELQLPRALEAEEAQALLAPGEGMLAYASTKAHLYVWLVKRDSIEWRRMDAPRADLAERVDHLRASLDIDWSAPPPEVAPGCKLVSANTGLADWPFDLCAAEEMQETLLGDLDLSGIEELIVVPDGPLESLPFAMLVSDRAQDGRPRWLIEDHSITTLPTTSSLRALRRSGSTQDGGERQPFLGLAPVEFDDASSDSALRGSPLSALPATDDEVRLISGLLGGGRDGTVIGPDASEAFAKSAPLDRYRVLSFATHGLLSREAARVTDGDISEMSLALRPGDGEDGMLTASEVAGLRLDADWVLLSACNTAGGDGDDAEGLSGLARAFFFAGARTLMVSHWYIDDAATSQLMADTMERSVTDDATSRAQALRQAQLAMLSQSNFAHPFYWAAFSVVGDNR